MTDRTSRLAAAFVALLAACASLAAASGPPPKDEIWMHGQGRLSRAVLPDGPVIPLVNTGQHFLDAMVALPSGEMLAAFESGGSPGLVKLAELKEDGSLRQIGVVEGPPYAHTFERPFSMALDHRGRLYLLIQTFNGIETSFRLAFVDPANAATLGTRKVEGVYSIATAPEGLWALTGEGLARLNPDTGTVGGNIAANFEDAGWIRSSLTAASSGLLYFISSYVCSPPCPSLTTVDPTSGHVEYAPFEIMADMEIALSTLAIRRRCSETATTRCLQGGRFLAEIAYEAHDGSSGSARVAPARSSDTGVFYFFSEDNWELMVKVLDGCALNGKFWVFSSASTDVGYTMVISDTETGAGKTYTNPRGQVAKTIADTAAFACTP
jgi:hypothetical protein